MQIVDRDGFIGWQSGILMYFKHGNGFATPDRDCIAAEDALNRGETVALTKNNRIVSYLEPGRDVIIEVNERSIKE